MSEVTQTLKVLRDAGIAAYDTHVPKDPPFPHVFLMLANRSYWDVSEPDDEPFQSRIDCEAWGRDSAEADAIALEVRNVLAVHPGGSYGNGFIAKCDVRDDRVDYAWKNPAGDERYSFYDLQIVLTQFRE